MSNQLFRQYKKELPDKLVESDQDRLANGFIRFCNPQMYQDMLEEGYGRSDAIVIGTTVFGDFLVWEQQKYVNLVSFSKHTVTVLASGFDFFFEDMEDEQFLKQYFEYDLYKEALKTIGVCREDECYTVNPIPALGGGSSVEKLQIGKLIEYNAISIQMAGTL